MNRCDHRRLVTQEENLEDCRDANEEDVTPYNGGCNRDGPILNQPIPEDDEICWEIHNFGEPCDEEDGCDDSLDSEDESGSQDESEDSSEEEDGSASEDEDENEDRSDVDEIFLEDIIIKTIEMSKLSSGTLALYSRAFEMLVLGSLLLLYL